MSHVRTLSDFTRHIETAREILIPRVGDQFLPKRVKFPNARITTVVEWDKNGVYNNLDKDRFPNVQQINFLCESPGSPAVLFRFVANPNFVWGLPPTDRNHRFFSELKDEYKLLLSREEAEALYQIADSPVYCALWTKYLETQRADHH